MGLIEVNNITNYGEPIVNNFDWWKLSGLLGVCIGFGFTYLNNKLAKRKERIEAGETFENQLKSFKDPIIKQAQDLKNYEDKINNNEYGVITLYLKHKFELIKSLNWQILIKYFKKKKHKDPIGYISNIYNSLDILNFQTEKQYEVYNTFHNETRDLMMEYKANLDLVRRKVSSYADTLDIKELSEDPVIQKYNELDLEYIYSKGINLKQLISLKETYHLKLMNDIPKIYNHPVYSTIKEGNLKARDIIHHLLQKIEEHKDFIEIVIISYKENYKVLYNEDLILK